MEGLLERRYVNSWQVVIIMKRLTLNECRRDMDSSEKETPSGITGKINIPRPISKSRNRGLLMRVKFIR